MTQYGSIYYIWKKKLKYIPQYHKGHTSRDGPWSLYYDFISYPDVIVSSVKVRRK